MSARKGKNPKNLSYLHSLPRTKEWKDKLRISNIKTYSNPKIREKISKIKKNKPHYNQRGKKHYNWQGGITSINQKIRGSLEMKLWQDSVFNRDCNYCQKCGENRISKLVAHHILNFSKYIDIRFAIDNGITFCNNCHKEFHKRYGRKNNIKEQVEEFLK